MRKNVKKVCFGILCACATLFLAGGCASTSTPVDQAGFPSVSGFAGDLQDIELPIEMSWDREESLTIKTESFNGGVWHYSGRVEPLSLKDYLVSAMQNNKWKLVGESTASDILLAFVKPNKTCMMVISDGTLGKTRLTLYVTIDRTAAAGLDPFGEAVEQ